jgi:hypothetical protein
MAIFSWNLLAGMIAVSSSELDLDDPLRAEGCSFANPLECCSVAAALSHTTRAPEEDPSQPPLRRWLWESGAEYLVTEANGDLEDFLGWTLFAFGPERSRVSGAEVGVPFLLSPPDPPPPIPDSPLIVTWQRLDGGYNFAGIAYGMVTDQDADGIPDAEDNCTQVQNGPLAGPNIQIDTDGDDYGNACDCDFDQSLTCGIADFNLFLPDFQSTVDSGVGTDMDSSGTVGIDDFNLFLSTRAASATTSS